MPFNTHFKEGKFTNQLGHIYEGKFINGRMEGYGTHINPDNYKQVGNFVDGAFLFGESFDVTGIKIHRGSVKEGKFHGQGT